jgi:hypothetical protein
MRVSVTMLIAVSAMVAVSSAQAPTSAPRLAPLKTATPSETQTDSVGTRVSQVPRLAPLASPQRPIDQSKTCTLPDRSRYMIDTSAIYEGRRYRCVQVYDGNLSPAGIGWVAVE